VLDTVAGGAEVIQEDNVRDAQLLNESFGVYNPGKIRGPHGAIDHRPGDAEARGNDTLFAEVVGGLAGKFLDDALELRKFLAREALLEDGRECAALFGKERQITLRPANVPCKDHQFPLPWLLALVYVRC